MQKIQDVLESVALVLFAVALVFLATESAARDKHVAKPFTGGGIVEPDILLPPNLQLVSGISCEVEHPTVNQSDFIVRCHVTYADKSTWDGPACARFNPQDNGFWKSDRKSHTETSNCERHIFEAVQKAKGQ